MLANHIYVALFVINFIKKIMPVEQYIYINFFYQIKKE